jgi:hypothetical protein
MAREQQPTRTAPARTGAQAYTPTSEQHTRRMRLLLRDQRTVDGFIHIGDHEALTTFLGSRDGGWVNLTDVRSQGTTERIAHLALKVERILWASAIDGDIRLVPDTHATAKRLAEVTLESGVTLHAEIPAPTGVRMSDVLASCGPFVPLIGARMSSGGIAFGDLVVNQDAMHAVVERAPKGNE